MPALLRSLAFAFLLSAPLHAQLSQWPVSTPGVPAMSSAFGPRQKASESLRYDWHRGVDIPMPIGTQILAAGDGLVTKAGTDPGYSDMLVQIRHGASPPYIYTNYLHISSALVAVNDSVVAGQAVALSGTGDSGFPHVHFEVRDGCQFQRCCRNPFDYLPYTDTTPAALAVEAQGDIAGMGRVLLLDASTPFDQLDLDGFGITWGTSATTLSMNGLTDFPPTVPEDLDDPVFAGEHGVYACIMPERFTTGYLTHDYRFLAWNLDPSATSGTATLTDVSGNAGPGAVAWNPAPVSISQPTTSVSVIPGAGLSLDHAVTNTSGGSLDLEFEGISAQTRTLVVTPTSITLGPGASTNVNISLTLGASFPEGTGDLVLLKVHAVGAPGTDVLGATLVDTAAGAAVTGWELLGR